MAYESGMPEQNPVPAEAAGPEPLNPGMQPTAAAPVEESPIQLALKPGQSQQEAETDLVSRHMGRFEKWKSWRQPLESIWTEIYRLYMSQPGKKKVLTRSNVSIPKAFQIVETGVSKLMSIITGQTPVFEVVKRFQFQTIAKETLVNIQALLDYQLDLASFVPKFASFLKQLVMYGTSYFYITWKVRREWVYERVATRKPFTLFGMRMPGFDLQWEKKLIYKVVERRPEIEMLAIDDVYPDPAASTPQDGDGFYVTSQMSMSEFEAMASGKFASYTNLTRVKEETTTSQNTESDFRQNRRSIRGTGEIKTSQRDKNMLDVVTFWGREDLDGDGIKEEVCLVFVNKTVVVKAKRNPYEHQKRPLAKGTMFPVPNEWFGMGLIEPVIPTIHELDTLHNQNIDMNNLIINRMWKIDPTQDVDPQTLKARPNGIVLATPLDAVMELKQDPLPFSPTQLMSMLESEIENTTAPKAVQGTPESGALGRTARGASLIISQALEKFSTSAKLLEEEVLKVVLTQMHQLDEQFLDSDETLLDDNMYGQIFPNKATPEQIRAQVSFKLLGLSETVGKETTLNQIFSWTNVYGPLIGPDANYQVAKLTWDMLGTKLSAKDLLPLQAQPPIPGLLAGTQPAPGQAVQGQIQQNGETSAPPPTPSGA